MTGNAWVRAGLAVVIGVTPLLGVFSLPDRVSASPGEPAGAREPLRSLIPLPSGRAVEQEHPAVPLEDDIVPGQVMVKYKGSSEARKEHVSFLGGDSPGRGAAAAVAIGKESVEEAVQRLGQDPEVEYAEPVYRGYYLDAPGPRIIDSPSASLRTGAAAYLKGSSVKGSWTADSPDDPFYREGMQWNLTVTDMVYAWNRVQLGGAQRTVTIAVLDSGIRGDHPDLQANILPGSGYDVMNSDKEPEDEFGHGTAVAGIAAAVTNNTTGLAGAAGPFGIRVIPIKVGDRGSNTITSENVAAGIKLAADQGADVINLSIGFRTEVMAVREAIRNAVQQGVIVVAAAGNNSNHWVNGEPGNREGWNAADERAAAYTSFPASMPEVISIGAVSRVGSELTIADFSSIGRVTAVAPGTGIVSTGIDRERPYVEGEGTSYAAPLAAAMAALLKARNPELTPAEIQAIFEDGSRKLKLPSHVTNDSTHFAAYYGGGLLSGETAFTKPRLHLAASWRQDEGEQAPVLLPVLSMRNDAGEDIGRVEGRLTLVTDRWDVAGEPRSTVTSLVYGESRLEDVLPDDEVFAVAVQAYDRIGPDTRYVRSGVTMVVRPPAAPGISLAGGDYTGSQTVKLSAATEGASIYYSFGDSGFTEYTGPFSISGSGTLKAYSEVRGVRSPEASSTYRISGVNSGGWYGSPGRLPEPDAPASPSSGAAEELKVSPERDQLLAQITAARGGAVVIEAKSNKPYNRLIIELPGEAWVGASAAGSDIQVRSDRFTLTIPADSVPIPNKESLVTLTVAFGGPASRPEYVVLASPVYDFSLQVGDEVVSSFRKPLTAEFHYEASRLLNLARAGVFSYNGARGAWEYQGGEVSVEEGVFRIPLEHFSHYAVLSWNRTFHDLAAHWAREAVERMAARQIADGMTETEFVPDAPVTRAQFTALLTRTLRLPAAPETPLAFGDVPEDAWYRDVLARAVSAGLVRGISDIRFEPDARLTREQMAVMLARATASALAAGAPQTEAAGDLSFGDRGHISPWALEAVEQAAGAGLLEGMPDGTFGPRRETTRAEAITVLSRLHEQQRARE